MADKIKQKEKINKKIADLKMENKFLEKDLKNQKKNIENLQNSMCVMRLPFSKDKFVRISKKHEEDVSNVFGEISKILNELSNLKSKISLQEVVIETAREVILQKNARWIDAKIIEILKEKIGVEVWLK